MLLPILGGSTAVWNTGLVFFQGTLLAGYLYAHLGSRYLRLQTQIAVHLILVALVLLALPLPALDSAGPATGVPPTGWLLEVLWRSLGLPLIAISASAPLLQRWFAHAGHSRSADPYFLYGASNLGSLLALLGFPFLLEPALGIRLQTRLWALGWVVLAAGLLACAAAVWFVRPTAPPRARRGQPAPTWRERGWWLALAFAPSSLLLGVTTHITTDVASTPLFWVIPLALYLSTFILAFARRPLIPHSRAVRGVPYAGILLVLALTWGALRAWLTFNVVLHLAAFFLLALVCHGKLADRRPAARRLTEFYLWIALGGVLGGSFNALIAPLVFHSVAEYPAAIALACGLALSGDELRQAGLRLQDVAVPGLLALLTLGPGFGLGLRPPRISTTVAVTIFALAALLGFSFRKRPLRFGLGLAVLFVMGPAAMGQGGLIHRERSFFGVYRVMRDPANRLRSLVHGTTLHGEEYVDPERWREPLSYYDRRGPAGQWFAAARRGRSLRVAVVGLGAGALTCYGRPGDRWTLFELDPLVVRLARDTSYFHFLSECGGEARIVLGDARRSLMREPDAAYDLLVLDAFSSDAIPMHLLTREAFVLYRRKLAPGGVLLAHISNRNMTLSPVVARLANAAHLSARIQRYSPPGSRAFGLAASGVASASVWVAMAAAPRSLASLSGDPRWQILRPDPSASLWTDDFSNILEVLNW